MNRLKAAQALKKLEMQLKGGPGSGPRPGGGSKPHSSQPSSAEISRGTIVPGTVHVLLESGRVVRPGGHGKWDDVSSEYSDPKKEAQRVKAVVEGSMPSGSKKDGLGQTQWHGVDSLGSSTNQKQFEKTLEVAKSLGFNVAGDRHLSSNVQDWKKTYTHPTGHTLTARKMGLSDNKTSYQLSFTPTQS